MSLHPFMVGGVVSVSRSYGSDGEVAARVPARKWRVFVVDDHPFVRDGLTGLLSSQPDFEVVGEASCAAEALEGLSDLKPDLAIIDLRLPDGSGSAVLHATWKMRWETYAVVLSAFKSDDDVVAAARAGARAYLLKTARSEEVLTVLRRVLAGENVLETEMPPGLLQRLRQKDLTPKELDMLRLVGLGMTNKQICRETGLAANTVKAHLRNVFLKLSVSNRSEAAAIALRRGLVS